MTARFLRAYTLFTGGMIGVGMFGLPYVVSRAGLLPALVSGVLVLGIVWAAHLAFADLVLRTGRGKRLPGYVGAHLGEAGRLLAAVANVGGIVGALLAYIIVGGTFFSLLLAPVVFVPPWLVSMVYAVVGAALLLRGLKQLPFLQSAILVLFGFTLVILGGSTFPVFRSDTLVLLGASSAWFAPYGVLLFSFWGMSLVPELVELHQRNWRQVRRTLTLGFLTAAVCYTFFAVLIAGTSGTGTTEDALTGLVRIIPPWAVVVGAFFGFLNTFDSFLALGLTLKRTLEYDFHVPPLAAWAVAMGAPLALTILGVQGFVRIVGVTGAVFIGLEGLLVLLAYRASGGSRASRFRALNAPVVFGGMILLLLSGVVLEIFKTVSGR